MNTNIQESDFTRLNNCINGNPRYYIGYSKVTPTQAENMHATKYRGKKFGRGYVVSGYSLKEDCERANKTYRSDSKHVKVLMDKHIVDCVEGRRSPKLAAQDIMQQFNSWDCEYERKHTPNNQKRFSYFLRGLPFNFETYSYCNTNKFLESLSITPPKRAASDEKSLELYHYLIYSAVLRNLKK